jgi:hypothetical protein
MKVLLLRQQPVIDSLVKAAVAATAVEVEFAVVEIAVAIVVASDFVTESETEFVIVIAPESVPEVVVNRQIEIMAAVAVLALEPVTGSVEVGL